MLQGEHSAILSTFIKLPFVIEIFVLSMFEWPLKTGSTVYGYLYLVQEMLFEAFQESNDFSKPCFLAEH